MEIQVRTHRKLPDNTKSRCSKPTSCESKDCRSSQQSSNYVRTYGLSVKIRPPKRSISQPAPTRRLSNTVGMDPLTEKTAQDEEDLDITLKHVQPQSSETDSLQPNSRPVELSSLDSSNFQRNEDLFDQLVHHFGSKSSTSSSRGRSRKRQRSSFYVPSNRRQSNSSNRRATLGPGSHASLCSTGVNGSYVKPSQSGDKSACGTLERTRSNVPLFIQRTSTPDSTLSDNSRIRDSNLRVSRIRALSTSSVEFQSEREQSSDGINCSSCSSKLDSTESESLANDLSTLPNRFDSKVALKRKSTGSESQSIQRSCAAIYLCPPQNRMLRSHNRRSLTPDPRHYEWYRGSPDSTRSGHSEYRSSSQDIFSHSNGSTNLDYMTADTIDRRRLRKRRIDKFSESIQSLHSSSSSLPPRSKSSLGVPIHSSEWGISPPREETTPSVGNENSLVSPVFYVDKNGRIRPRNSSRSNCSTPPIPAEWTQQNQNKEDITICSIDSSGDQHTATKAQDNEGHPSNRRNADLADKAKKAEPKKIRNIKKSKLKDAESLNCSRLSEQDEEELMSNLIAAMKELKDIAEVARVIDDVDNEEWLIVFIGELEHRLRGFISMHVNENEETSDNDVLAREKVTLFSVLIDLIRFLKDRSAYRMHRRQSLETHVDGIHNKSIPTDGDRPLEGRKADGTLQRLKKMAATTPVNPFEMQRWQRQLMNLASTLEKYLGVLENRKNEETEADGIQHCNDSTEQRFSDGRSDYSSGSQDQTPEFNRRLSARSQTSSGISTISQSASQHGGRLARAIRISEDVENPSSVVEDVPSNRRLPLSEHNVNNNNDNSSISSSPIRRLPVIDLRSVENGSEILEDISPPTICRKDRRFLQTQEEKDRLYRKRDQENLVKKGSLHSTNIPRGRVVSAYCRIPHDVSIPHAVMKRSVSISNVSCDLQRPSDDVSRHVTEFRMTIGMQRGRNKVDHQTASTRARSCDNSRSRRRRRDSPDEEDNLNKVHQPIAIRGLDENRRTGARPKIRQNSVANQHEEHPTRQVPIEHPERSITSSISTQCDLDVGWRQKMAEDKMKQMKRRADVLKRGLDEAREDRDEKERKIAVLQAKLERSKKNMVYGESEKGAIEEEVDRLKKLLKESTKDSDEEIASLKKRLKDLEKKLEKETEKYKRMENMVTRLQQEFSDSNEQCELMSKGKCELEERIRELMVALMQEKEHNRQMQEENTRLEEELLASNQRLNAIADQTELINLNNDLQRLNLSGAASHDLQLTADELRGSLGTAEVKIDELSQENHRLTVENADLTEALTCEQMMTKEATNCFYEQVNYLNHELIMKEEAKNAQAEQYDKEITRILFEQDGEDSSKLRKEMEKAKHDLEEERLRLKRLEKENDEIQQSELKQQQQTTTGDQRDNSKASNVGGTEDKAIQAEDTSYMRMQAFDFYTREAQRDGRRLDERGRQLELEARQKLRESRDAMRQINSISRERISLKNPK